MPLGTVSVNVKAPPPVELTARLLIPLSWSVTMSPADRPVTVPLTEKVFVTHVTMTLMTFATTVPVPLVTVQVWLGLLGCVRTVTAYIDVPEMDIENVNGPFAA